MIRIVSKNGKISITKDGGGNNCIINCDTNGNVSITTRGSGASPINLSVSADGVFNRRNNAARNANAGKTGGHTDSELDSMVSFDPMTDEEWERIRQSQTHNS